LNLYKRKRQQHVKKEATPKDVKHAKGSPMEFDTLLDDDVLVATLEQAERSLGAGSKQAWTNIVDSTGTKSFSPSANLNNVIQFPRTTDSTGRVTDGDSVQNDLPLVSPCGRMGLRSAVTFAATPSRATRAGLTYLSVSSQIASSPPVDGKALYGVYGTTRQLLDTDVAVSDESPSISQQMTHDPYLHKRVITKGESIETDFDSYCLDDTYLIEALDTAENALASKATVKREEDMHEEPDRMKARLKDDIRMQQRLEQQTIESVTSNHRKTPELPVVSPVKTSIARNPYTKEKSRRSVVKPPPFNFDSYCLDGVVLSQALDDCESSLARSMSNQLSDTSDILTPGSQESIARTTVPIVTPTKRQNPYRSVFEQ
jgi:hypothetical protein